MWNPFSSVSIPTCLSWYPYHLAKTSWWMDCQLPKPPMDPDGSYKVCHESVWTVSGLLWSSHSSLFVSRHVSCSRPSTLVFSSLASWLHATWWRVFDHEVEGVFIPHKTHWTNEWAYPGGYLNYMTWFTWWRIGDSRSGSSFFNAWVSIQEP